MTRRARTASLMGLIVALGVLGTAPAFADSLYTEDSGGILIDRLGDKRSGLGPGGVITIVVSENMVASSQANTKLNKQGRTQASWDTGSILPQNTRAARSAIDLNGQSQFQGDGVTKRADTITLLVSATIMEVLPDGSLRIEGKKNLRVNDEESTVEVSGIVRPFDIDASNQVNSAKIANLRVDFRGTGTASAKATPGLLTRIFSWLF